MMEERHIIDDEKKCECNGNAKQQKQHIVHSNNNMKEGSGKNTKEKQSLYFQLATKRCFLHVVFSAASKLENGDESYRARKNSLHRQY